MLNRVRVSVILTGMVLLIVQALLAEKSFTGNVTGVSTYVYRGNKQNNGPALQMYAAFAAKSLSAGLWVSSVDFGGDTEIETDPFVELSLSSGAVKSAIGTIIYSYDMFEAFNAGADFEIELYGKVSFGALGLTGYFVPSQASTDYDANSSLYWIEGTTGIKKAGATWSVLAAYGTYSSRWWVPADKDPVGLLVFTAAKPVTEKFAVSWNYAISSKEAMGNNFWVAAGYTF